MSQAARHDLARERVLDLREVPHDLRSTGGEMNTKFIEIRDEGTCILALAIQMQATATGLGDRTFTDPAIAEIERWFLHYRSGYPDDGSSIMLMCLCDGKATNDPYEWIALGMGSRTMGNAHNWITDHWRDVKDGDVVDVQFILGETKVPKVSERLIGNH
jgi:hypothetical protein